MTGDIDRWITINGVHIPIMKGESKARAVGNFIRNRRNKKLNNRMDEAVKKMKEEQTKEEKGSLNRANAYMEDKYGKNWNKEKSIKGYNTDPDNKVGKAEAAYKKTWEDATNDYVKRDEEAYEKVRFKNANREAIMRNYPNRLKSDLEWARAEFAYRQAQNDLEKQKEYKEASLNNARRSREESSLMAYESALYAPSSRYKLKGKVENVVTDYWNGNGKYQKQYNEVLKYQDEGKVPKGASGALNKLNNFGHRYYRYYNDGDMPRTEFKEYFGKDTYMPSSAGSFRQYFPEEGVKGFNAYLERKANTLIVTAHNRIKTLENKPASTNRKLNSAYKKYLEEHPSSKISLSEFDKWYK